MSTRGKGTSPARGGDRMEPSAFARIRQALGKSQKELAALLGISLKAVESYEQGWRKVPAHVERVVYFLLFKLGDDGAGEGPPCWEMRDCPEETRTKCVAYVAKEGRFCWFFTGRLCARAADDSAKGGRLGGCYDCPVFSSRLSKVRSA